jgi:hypothetical protein
MILSSCLTYAICSEEPRASLNKYFSVPQTKNKITEVSDTVHLFSMDERKTNLMQLLYIFIVAVGDALHVS